MKRFRFRDRFASYQFRTVFGPGKSGDVDLAGVQHDHACIFHPSLPSISRLRIETLEEVILPDGSDGGNLATRRDGSGGLTVIPFDCQ